MKKFEVHALAEYIGAVTSIFLYFAPTPTILDVTRTETTEGFSPLPYVATLLNSGMWIAYNSHNPLMILVYTAGIITEATYIAIFYGFSTHGVRRKIRWLLCADAVFYGIVLVISYGGPSEDAQIKAFIGKMSLISCVYMYASPLIMMKTVVQTRDLKFLPLLPVLGTLLSGSSGILSARLSQDKYSMISSSIGTALSITQIVVYLYVKYKSRDGQVAGINAEDAVVAAGGAGGSVAARAAGGSVAEGAAGGSVAVASTGADGSIATEAASGSMAIKMAGAADRSEEANESEAIEAAGGSVATGADGPMATEAASGSVVIEMAGAADGSEAIEVADGSEVMEEAEGSVATEAASGSVEIKMAGAADGSEAANESEPIEAAGGSVATGADGPMATEVASGSVAIEMAGAADGSEAIEVADGSEVMEEAEGSVVTEAASGSVTIEMAGAADGSEAIEAAGGSVATEAADEGQVPKAAAEEA